MIDSVKAYSKLSILCDLHFILERRKLDVVDVNQGKAAPVFTLILTRWFKATEPPKLSINFLKLPG